jgi:hypothetical protein
MKLIMTYTIDGGYECCSYDEILPIEYDSAEALICDFEAELDKAIAKGSYESFSFGIETFWVNHFYDQHTKTKTLPDILTLEDWFSNNNICP